MPFDFKDFLFNFRKVIPKKQRLICLGILISFILLSIHVYFQEDLLIDQILIQVPHQIFPDRWDTVFRVAYRLTGIKVTALVVTLTLGILIWRCYWIEAQVVAVSALGVLILVDQILKPLIARNRPPDRLVEVVGRTFPSGHATGNFLLYFLLSYLLAQRYPKWTVYIYGVATGLVLLIGWSSVYLRCHWPSDIVAGYGLGYLCLTLSLAALQIARSKQRQN